MRFSLKKFFIFVFSAIAFFPAFAVTMDGESLAKMHPRRPGLASCGCFWEVQFDLNKKSAAYAHEMLKMFNELNVRPRLSSTGVDVVRGERDLCNRYRSTPLDRKYDDATEDRLLEIFARLEKQEGLRIQCGKNDDFGEKFYCVCPVPGVKVGN